MSSAPSDLETVAATHGAERSHQPIDEFDDADDLDDSLAAAVVRAPEIDVPERLQPGAIVASTYRVIGILGTGAMGVVYEALDQLLDRRVALKLHISAARADRVSRMWREAKAMARLSDPHVVMVHEVGWHEGRVYIAMELVEGTSLRSWSRQRTRSPVEVVDVYVQAARGLAAAHRAGIVHRDFKPDNILIAADGRVKVADFGLARAVGSEGSDRGETDALVTEVTQSGATVGTPAYMAPEQIAGKVIGAPADQFAFCVALYESLWGRRPFTGATLAELQANLSSADPAPPPAEPAVPRAVTSAVLRGLRREPSDRWPDMGTLASALEQAIAPRRRRAGTIALGIAVVGAASWIARGQLQEQPCAGVDAAIDDTWNEDTRAAVATAFTATGSGLADAASIEIAASLDAWSDAWRHARKDACEATRVTGSQSEARMDARMDCLERARVQTAAIVDVLEQADLEVVSRVNEIGAALPWLQTCDDPESLAAADVVAPEDRATHDLLVAEVASVRAEVVVGHWQAARTLADELLPRVDAAGYEQLGGSLRAERGRALRLLDERDAAIEDLSRASRSALGVGDLQTAVRRLEQLALALGYNERATDESLRWLDMAVTLAERAGSPAEDRLFLDIARAKVLVDGMRGAAAVDLAREVLAEIPPGEHARARVNLLLVLGQALKLDGQLEDAVSTLEEAATSAEAVYGRGHPVLANVLGDLGDAQSGVGRLDDALVTHRRQLAICEEALGPRAAGSLQARTSIAQTLEAQGDLRSARAELETVLELQRGGSDIYGFIDTAYSLANLVIDLGEPVAAEPQIRALLEPAREAYGEDSLGLVRVESLLSRSLLNQGRTEEAWVWVERALTRAERDAELDELNLAMMSANAATVAAAAGRHEQALALLGRAQGIVASTPGTQSTQIAQLLQVRSQVLSAMGRHEDAARALAEAITAYEGTVDPGDLRIVRATLQLGHELVLAKSWSDAIAPLEEAIARAPAAALPEWEAAMGRLYLAQALWPDRRQRQRALALAREASDALQEPLFVDNLAEVEAWLEAHD